MKYVIIRCEDRATVGNQLAPLLEGAKTSHLQQLAQAGAAGVIRPRALRRMINQFDVHRALLGVRPDDISLRPGRCDAASINRTLASGETAWCCQLVTQHDGQIIDPTAGNIPTKESELLIQVLDESLGSEARQWDVGAGPHHLLIANDPALTFEDHAAIPPPELLVGQKWRRHLPKGSAGDALRQVMEQAMTLLESHPVNRVRIDLGENPANMLWLWGPGHAESQTTFVERAGLSAAVVSSNFLLQGLACLLGLTCEEMPSGFDADTLRQISERVGALLERHDLVYVHLVVDSLDAVERQCAMERIDQLLLRPMTDTVSQRGPWRLLTAIDDRSSPLVPFVAIGTGLPQQPIATLALQSFTESPLKFGEDGEALAWLTRNEAGARAATIR